MKRLLSILFLLCALTIHSQNRFVALSYNVENLFDTRHDSLKNDQEFLPDAVRHWTPSRYWRKLNSIARVVASAHEVHIPDVVCLCEVENDSCLTDLTRRSALRTADYRYIMTSSSDPRGIDVALLYQPGTFRPIFSQSLRVGENTTLRDMLHVSGTLLNGDTLDIFCVHMPSRRGGKTESEPRRRLVADLLRKTTDSISTARNNPHILVMGDFNDNPSDKSLAIITGENQADHAVTSQPHLCNLMAIMPLTTHPEVHGTYFYQGEWDMLDQMLVSQSMLSVESRVRVVEKSVRIVDFDFLLESDRRFRKLKPRRTYTGMRYNGGYSDHLPVMVEMEVKE